MKISLGLKTDSNLNIRNKYKIKALFQRAETEE